MSLWQIRTEDDLRIVLKELKRIAFGEFIDDLQLSSKITEAFGIQTVKVDDVGDKVGMERLGKDDIWSNFGATLIIACIVIFLFIALLFGAIYVARRVKISDKNKKRLNDLKQKIFYNAFIRFFLLNALKFHMTAFIIMK